jgi:hypothetical protein
MNNTNNITKRFEFIIPNNTLDGFIGVDLYDPRMYAFDCRKKNYTNATLRVYRDGNPVPNAWWKFSDKNQYGFVH